MPAKKKIIIIKGDKFGKWTVIEPVCDKPKGVKGSNSYTLCSCECGYVSKVSTYNIFSGVSTGCGGCKPKIIKHGECSSPLYQTWAGMKNRVKRSKSYINRDTKVQDSWLEDYESFRDYIIKNLGDKPDGYSLDRIANEGDYCEGNVRWASQTTQNNNKSNNVRYEYKGNLVSARYIAEHCGMPLNVIKLRLSRGWSVDRAINQPIRSTRH